MITSLHALPELQGCPAEGGGSDQLLTERCLMQDQERHFLQRLSPMTDLSEQLGGV